VVIARAGASTVTELAAVGAAAIYVPFPHAVDDHQTTNARFVVDAGGGWLIPQNELKAQDLANRLQFMTRRTLLACAEKAYAVRQVEAVSHVVAACEQLAAKGKK
jgi:UDP-N-acetylglucosamine--N-acetylmuramyl-(pentapeptide) pyrophosphoryl-undecaprenol N-acetylglucosamine transferase